MASRHQMALSFSVVVLLVTATTVHSSGLNDTLPGDGGTIVGGQNATIEEFPWQVSLEIDGSLLCGGSVVADRWVLTAGNCFLGTRDYVVRSSSSTKERGGLTHAVKRWIVHELYNTTALYDYDIALLEMEEPFVWTEQLQPVRGLATEDPPVGSRVVASGWGRLRDGGPLSDQLQQVAMSIVDWKDCSRIYETAGLPLVTETKVCSIEPDKGDCHGDGGGPVIDEKTRVQVGIVSGGGPCASEFPNVHTSVAKLRGWISEKTGAQEEVETSTETTPPLIEWLPL